MQEGVEGIGVLTQEGEGWQGVSQEGGVEAFSVPRTVPG